MKKGVVFFACLLLLLVFAGTAFANDDAALIVSRVIESFDNTETRQWVSIGSKFATEGYPESQLVEAWPDALFGDNRQGEELRCLGVHGRFDRQGYNYIELIPTDEDENPAPVELPGQVRTLDVWVWGSNYDYYLEAHVLDHRGINHVLPLGNLDFVGWRNLSVDVPGTIPQASANIPGLNPLRLTKIVIWTRPRERVNDFYVYIDHIKVLTDVFLDRYDGDDLGDPERMDELWNAEAEE
ncbi:MAG: flagellar filament outer layer protein FlaA [Spirochaetia bacterium]